MLVVDSHTDSSALLEMLFKEYGIETIVATDAKEALKFMQQDCPHLLISEILLPDEDGYSLIKKVKTFETTYRVRIPSIALTACASTRDRVNALAAGFCTHLPKPFDINELMLTIAHLLGIVQECTAISHSTT